MKYRIHEEAGGIGVELEDLGGEQQRLLEVFERCGRGCQLCMAEGEPNPGALRIETDGDRLLLHLHPSGDGVNNEQVVDCLRHTMDRVTRSR